MATVSGQVTASGSPRIGTGFNVGHPTKGEYEITYRESVFKDQPIVVATVVASTDEEVCCGTVTSSTASGFKLFIETMESTPANRSFNFISEAAT